jgi:ABC-2 type transport system ATP-binding protein
MLIKAARIQGFFMIEVLHLSKKYAGFEAVRDVSFSAARAQVIGFLGPNGAGKTTIMKVLAGYHFPSSGSVTIDGLSAEAETVAVKNRIGYLPENNPLYGDMTPREFLHFAAAARLIRKNERENAVNAAIAACALSRVETQRIESLSKGYRQRLGLAQAIVHDPPILILDEPTSGLDPNQIIEMRELIRRLGKSKTVILSTHILQEVEALCSRVIILNEGCIAAQGTQEELAAAIFPASAGAKNAARTAGGKKITLEDIFVHVTKKSSSLTTADEGEKK